MDLLIVIVNYRTPALTVDCLRSLIPEVSGHRGMRVDVVDNASGDDSASQVAGAIEAEGWGGWATSRVLPTNGGFAYGNNAAIRGPLEGDDPPRYVLLLNPDTIVRPGAVSALVAFMDAHPGAGIAGSRLEDPDGTPQVSAFRFPTVLGELEGGMQLGIVTRLLSRWSVVRPVPEVDTQTDWVAGASMIVRREVFEAIGLLDEEYFMYFEEVDFCLRAARAGWPCWYVPESRVVHLVGQASGVTDATKAARRRPAYWFESRRRYFLKNHGRPYAAAADAAWAGGHVSWRLRRKIQGRRGVIPEKLLLDFVRHSAVARGLPR